MPLCQRHNHHVNCFDYTVHCWTAETYPLKGCWPADGDHTWPGRGSTGRPIAGDELPVEGLAPLRPRLCRPAASGHTRLKNEGIPDILYRIDARRLKRAQPLGPERQDFCRGQETLQRSKNGHGACKYQVKYKHGGQRRCGRLRFERVNLIVFIGKDIAKKKMQCSTSESTERHNKCEQAPTPEVLTLGGPIPTACAAERGQPNVRLASARVGRPVGIVISCQPLLKPRFGTRAGAALGNESPPRFVTPIP